MPPSRHLFQAYDAPDLQDQFGTLSLQPTANEDGTPLCLSHKVVCQKRVCRDYANLLKRLEKKEREKEKEEKKAPLNFKGNYRFGLEIFPWSARTTDSPLEYHLNFVAWHQDKLDLEATIDSTLAGEDLGTIELEPGLRAKAGACQGARLPLTPPDGN